MYVKISVKYFTTGIRPYRPLSRVTFYYMCK